MFLNLVFDVFWTPGVGATSIDEFVSKPCSIKLFSSMLSAYTTDAISFYTFEAIGLILILSSVSITACYFLGELALCCLL